MRHMIALGLLASVLPAAMGADDADPLTVYPRSEALAANHAWHKKSDKNEIRMSWFLDGNPRIAIVCTANLRSAKVTTSREVYDWASQATHTRELRPAQVKVFAALAKNLPASAQTPELKNLVLVSVSEKGQVKTRLYDRSALPREVVPLSELTSGYRETK